MNAAQQVDAPEIVSFGFAFDSSARCRLKYYPSNNHSPGTIPVIFDVGPSNMNNRFIVSDAFLISQRGLILVPGFQLPLNQKISNGDRVIVKMADGKCIDDRIKFLSCFKDENSEFVHVILFGNHDKNNIIGSEIIHNMAQQVDAPGPGPSAT